jgi:mono/diheme cytochrome c family protein
MWRRSSCLAEDASRAKRMAMPAFGDAYSDDEIAAAANYVTERFGAAGSRLTAENVASLRLTR